MKKIKLLMLALCSLMCTAVAACDLTGGMGGSSLSEAPTSTENQTQSSSISEEETPDDGGETPDDGGQTPDDGGETPDDGGETPDDGGQNPDDGGETPDDGGQTPEDSGQTPGGGETPDDGGQTPEGGGQTPGGGETPDDGGQTPEGGGQTPGGGETPDDGGQTPEDSGQTPGGGETPDDGGQTPDDGGQTPGGGETPDDGGQTPDDGGQTPDDGGEEIPDGKMLATVYYYTIADENGSLQYSGLVDKDATLNEFLTEHIDGIQKVFNDYFGHTEYDDLYYDDEFFTGAFWIIGCNLVKGNDKLSDYLSPTVKEFDLNCTPSGWGLNTGICVCDDPVNHYHSLPTTPFPFGVCIADFVNWMYEHGSFEMSYEESLTKGYWAEEGHSEPLTDDYMTFDRVLCFVYNQQGEEGGEVLPTEFTVYMPAVYEYYYSEMGEVSSMAEKLSQQTIYMQSTTVGEVYRDCYGDDPDYTFNYYMDGVQVSENTVLTKDCAVVCVWENVDVVLPPFTITVSLEGMESISYTYYRPIALRDAIEKYCTAKKIKMDDYVWADWESVWMSFDINTAWAYNTTIQGRVYVEPEKPTTQTISVLKYDGVTETKESYTIGFDVKSGAFIQQYLFPAFNYENAWENEYLFFFYGDYLNPIYGDELLENYINNILMIKRSVLEAGYTVQLDFMHRGDQFNQTYEQSFYMPFTARNLVYEITGWADIDCMSYQVTINGEVLSYGDSEKLFEEFEQYPQYKNVSIVVRPMYEVTVDVRVADEMEKSKSMIFYGTVNLPIIAEAVGLNYDFSQYGWKVGYSEEYYWEPSGMLMMSDYYMYIMVEARKVYTDIYFVTADGMEMSFETSMYYDNMYAWDWSVNAKTAFETIVGTGEGADKFDDFTWIAKSEMGEFVVTANDLLTYIIAAEYDYWDTARNYRTVYSLYGTRKTVTVRVVEQGMNGEIEKGEKVYDTNVTVGDILSAYGYKEADIWFMVDPLMGGWSNNFPSEWPWNTVVTWPIRICVYKY